MKASLKGLNHHLIIIILKFTMGSETLTRQSQSTKKHFKRSKDYSQNKIKNMNAQTKYIRQDIKDKLQDPYEFEDTQGAELHHETCNTVLMFNSKKDAENFLGSDLLEAMKKIKEYEESNFGECTTDLFDVLKVANMLAYILGEEILNESKTLQDKWDDCLSIEDLKQIEKEL